MKQNSANDFYIKVCIWTFFCLILSGICYQIKIVIVSVQTSGNASSAFHTIQEINLLQKKYATKHGGRFAPNFDELIKGENLDEKFTGEDSTVKGYTFLMNVDEPSDLKPAFYSINADPLYCDCVAMHFYFDSSIGTVKYTEEERPAKADDPGI